MTWYAIGNFRETELPGIAIGDPATVWLMSDNIIQFADMSKPPQPVAENHLGIKRPCSASPACRNAQSPRLWAGTRSMPRGSSGGTSTAALRPRQSFGCSTKRERECKPATKQLAQERPKWWSGRWESNPRHTAWEAVVLPLNYARIFQICRCASPGSPARRPSRTEYVDSLTMPRSRPLSARCLRDA